MSDAAETFLEVNGPSLTSELAEHLVETLGVSPVAARKRVSRLAGNVRRLAFITFPRKAKFMYLQQQFGSPIYWDKLIAALQRTNSAYGHAIAALQQRDGVVPEAHFRVVCGAPLKQKKHLSPATIFSRLDEAGLVRKFSLPSVGDCVGLVQSDEHYDYLAADLHARLMTEELLLKAVSDWLKKLGIVSYEKVAMRGGSDVPMVGTFAWDLTAPSYLGFMMKAGRDGTSKPGFVACDVHLGKSITPAGIRPFINKCKTLRSLRNIGPCMQIFVADRYHGEAFKLLKQNGIVPATPSNLFGEEVAKGLSQLSSVLRKAASSMTVDPTEFDELFSKLGKIEGASHQLRGTLFEYLTAEIARRNGATQVIMNRICKSLKGEKAEADVVAIKENNQITFIECKGYSPYGEIPDEYVKRWLQHSVPIFYRAIKEHPDWRNLKVGFEFWSTAPLSADALALIDKASSITKETRYTLRLCRGLDILKICKATKDDGLVVAFRKHFMKPGIN